MEPRVEWASPRDQVSGAPSFSGACVLTSVLPEKICLQSPGHWGWGQPESSPAPLPPWHCNLSCWLCTLGTDTKAYCSLLLAPLYALGAENARAWTLGLETPELLQALCSSSLAKWSWVNYSLFLVYGFNGWTLYRCKTAGTQYVLK